MSEWRETKKAIRLFGIWKVLYWRFVYRHHMRFIHKRGRHQWRRNEWPRFDHCDWCGAHRSITSPEAK